MATSVIRFQIKNAEREPAPWGVQFGNRVAPLAGSYATTADFVRFGLAEAKAAQPDHATLALSDLRILPPVTPNQQFVCQGVNYTSHLRESGMDPGDVPFNMLFTKSPHCITGAYDEIYRLVEGPFMSSMMREPDRPNGVPNIAHGGYFMLVDGNLHIRGVYDSNDIHRLDALNRDARYLARTQK